MNTLSICIPTYEMNGLGDIFLKHSFDMLLAQTFKDFNVIISDHAKSDMIEKVCDEYKDRLRIVYHKNAVGRGNSSVNCNNAIKKADGKLIKVLFQDDFLYHEKSLEEIVHAFDMTKDAWLVTACTHSTDGVHFFNPFYPAYNDKIYLGKNTISSPSVLTIKNDQPLLFDEKLLWLMDCDYYERCYRAFGAPKIVNTVNVVNRVGEHQVSNTMVHTMRKIKELIYIIRKYRNYDRHRTV